MILLTTATPWETRPLAAGLGLAQDPGSSGLYAGVMAGRRLLLAEVGVGPRRAAEALKRLDGRTAALVLSAGFAGALAPGLSPGDLVADLRGAPAGWGEAAQKIAARIGAALSLGQVVSVDHVCTPAEKMRLGAVALSGAVAPSGKGEERASGDDRPLAVDMESETVRAWAASRGAGFLSVRVVLDAADERMPAAAPKGAGAGALARYVLGNLRDVPVIARLALRQGPAMRRLCGFLKPWISEVLPDGNDA